MISNRFRNPGQLFEAMAPVVSQAIEGEYDGRRDLCIFATRIAIEVSAYFGILARPQPVRVVLYNAAFAAHIENEFTEVDVRTWSRIDGSYSIGVGFGCRGPQPPDRWNGHLIAVADGWFGDLAINQAERLDRGIVTGAAVVAPYPGCPRWRLCNSAATTIEYEAIDDRSFLGAPDWRNERRRRGIVAKAIRALKLR
jgi:hypothetical protein